MPRAKKETHLFFEQEDDEIQIRSWDKDLNAAVRKLKEKHPDLVWIRDNDDDEPGYLWAAVKLTNFLFYPIPPRSAKCKAAQTVNGKNHAENLRRGDADPK